MAEYLRVDHAAAANFQPAGFGAFRGFNHPFNVDFGRGFGKREIRRTQAHLDVFFKEGGHKLLQNAFQVGEADAFID